LDIAHDIFISYSSIDKDAAEKICSILEENGISCWMAPRNITPGMPFAEAIIDGIKSSKVFILVYSSSSNNSTQVIREVDRAVHNGLSIINLRLEDVPLSKQLEYYISNVHWMDAITPPLEQHIQQLCNVVKMFLKPEEVQDIEIAEALRKGIIKQKEPAGTGKRSHITKRRTNLVSVILPAIVIAIVSLIIFLIGYIKQARAGSIESIVVLPFGNYTGDDTLDDAISGMHSLLISKIGEIAGLRIIGRVTSDLYKNTDKSIQQITRELNVDAAIELDVMFMGDTIFFQPRLMSGGRKEKQLWIGDYMEAKGNLFEVYNQVIKQIVGEVKISLTPKEEARLAVSRTIDPDVIDEYLKGYYYAGDLSEASLFKARDYLNEAIEKEPDWAQLYATLAQVWQIIGGMGVESPEIANPKVYESLNKALDLDPDLAEVHFTSAYMAYSVEWNWKKAEEEFLKAISINPNDALARMIYAHMLYALQRPKEGSAQATLAIKLDPLNPLLQIEYAVSLQMRRDFASAFSVLEKVLASDPDNVVANSSIEAAAFQLGDSNRVFEADKNYLPRLYSFNEENMNEIEKIYNERGFNAAFEELMRQMEILAETGWVSCFDMACKYYMLKQDDMAIEWIEKGVDVKEGEIVLIGTGFGNFTRLYDNPRFIEVLKKMNLPLPKSD